MRRLRRSLKGQTLSHDDGLLKAGAFSLLIHIALAVLLTISGRPSIREMPSVYHVTIRPFAARGDGGPLGSSVPGSRGSPGPEATERSKSVEKPSTKESTKKQKLYELAANRTSEGLKRTRKKEDVDKQKSYKHLQEALEEINKKAALDQIQKRVALRAKSERGTTGESGAASSSGPGTGSGSGTGTGPGSVGSPTGGSPWGSLSGGSSAFESKLNDYYNMVWAKIKKEWTLPGDLPKGGANLETVIVVVIDRSGKIQKSWFEKKSGNSQYDQMAMRAIKKAEPLPAIPREFSDETFEVGIRFHPE